MGVKEGHSGRCAEGEIIIDDDLVGFLSSFFACTGLKVVEEGVPDPGDGALFFAASNGVFDPCDGHGDAQRSKRL